MPLAACVYDKVIGLFCIQGADALANDGVYSNFFFQYDGYGYYLPMVYAEGSVALGTKVIRKKSSIHVDAKQDVQRRLFSLFFLALASTFRYICSLIDTTTCFS